MLSYGEELHEESDEQRDRSSFERGLRGERLKRYARLSTSATVQCSLFAALYSILSRIEAEGLFKFDIE